MTLLRPLADSLRDGSPGRAVRRATAAASLGLLVLALAASQVDAAGGGVKAAIKKSTLIVNGTPSADVIVLRLASNDAATLEVDAGGDGTAEFSFARSRFTKIDVFGGGGNDTIRVDQANGAFTDTEITRLFGDDGGDTLVGGAGQETLGGGAGDDTIDGNIGADSIAGDAGSDVISWDPGDGSDTVNGGTGTDRVAFRGANIGETIEVVPAGGRVHLTRNIATVVLDLGTVERVDVDVVGGADALGVGDLSATDLDLVAFNLAGSGGGGDSAADSLVVNGTSADDVITLTGIPGGVEAAVQGGATTRVIGLEAGLDHVYTDGAGGADITEANGTSDSDGLAVTAAGPLVALGGSSFGPFVVETADEFVRLNGLGAGDTLSAVGDIASVTSLVLNGGDGNDTLLGGNGADVLNGGAGNDTLAGRIGPDQVNGESDDDDILWNPGDASDTAEGGPGSDRLTLSGANIGEIITVSANGNRARVTRNIGTVELSLGGVEAASFLVRGGGDQVIVDDLSATELKGVDVDLDGGAGAGDAVTDTVQVLGSPADDTISLGRDGAALVAGVPGGATTRVFNIEGAFDAIQVDGAAGEDVTAANGSAGPDVMSAVPSIDRFVIDGGPFAGFRVETFDETVRLNGLAGDDSLAAVSGSDPIAALVLDGGDGADTLLGRNFADVLIGGDGPDTLDGNQGPDQVSGDAGDDVITWDPGDGNDSIEGGADADRFVFRGSNIGELVDIGAPNGRLIISRNIGTVSVDLGGVETLDVRLVGGHDIIAVNDLSATDVSDVQVDLVAAGGGGDAIDDMVVVLGTPGDDAIAIEGAGGGIDVDIPGAATTRITGAEAALDELFVNGEAGADTFSVVGPVASLIKLVTNQ
jgi:Ca2+-binding RTX toxin-like protein